jgi:hypothetical protein
MSDDPRQSSLVDETLRYLEVVLASIVYGAGAYANTIVDFLFRPARFDAAILPGPSGQHAPVDPRRYLPPLTFLLLNQIFYFYVYPRQERGPTRTVIEAMPGPIRQALDRIESSVREPNLVAVLLVVGPLVLIAAFHALLTTWGFRAQRVRIAFATILDVTCYSIGTMLGTVGLSAVVGATLTDHALSGRLRGIPLAAYVAFMVVPFVTTWLWCIVRHFALAHEVTRTSWGRAIGVVLGATLALGALVATLLALAGHRGDDAQPRTASAIARSLQCRMA